jgi:hypothetical protein
MRCRAFPDKAGDPRSTYAVFAYAIEDFTASRQQSIPVGMVPVWKDLRRFRNISRDAIKSIMLIA